MQIAAAKWQSGNFLINTPRKRAKQHLPNIPMRRNSTGTFSYALVPSGPILAVLLSPNALYLTLLSTIAGIVFQAPPLLKLSFAVTDGTAIIKINCASRSGCPQDGRKYMASRCSAGSGVSRLYQHPGCNQSRGDDEGRLVPAASYGQAHYR